MGAQSGRCALLMGVAGILGAVKHGRRGWAAKLNADYFRDGVSLREQDAGRAMPTLLDLDAAR
jgi:hypothetical protein